MAGDMESYIGSSSKPGLLNVMFEEVLFVQSCSSCIESPSLWLLDFLFLYGKISVHVILLFSSPYVE